MSSTESSRRFQFIREIASGGFGSVYVTKVIHADGFSRLVAVKLLHPRWSENEEIASRMRDEARLLGWLRHKNIVDVMDLTLIDGRCAVIMEYLEAVDAKMLINLGIEQERAIPVRVALEVCAAVASALDAAYNRPPYAGEKPLRVIHRDIKPSNVMVDESGLVKVLDFGVARAEFDERESKTQEMAFGSLEYMPPERLFFEPESPASDVYSLGATLYEMLALEKFGKAKLRPREHGAFFEERFTALGDIFGTQDAVRDELHDLLAALLAFDEPDRPSAADLVGRMRSFARRLPGESLDEWAETHVPPLLQRNRETDPTPSPGSLVGRVLTEDVRAFEAANPWDENTGMSTAAVSGVFDESSGQLLDDARWKAFKEATINEMAQSGELGPVRAPQASPPPPPENIQSHESKPGVRSSTASPPKERAVAPLASSIPPVIAVPTPSPAPTVRMVLPEKARKKASRVQEVQEAPPRRKSGTLRMVASALLLIMLGVGLLLVAAGVAAIILALLWGQGRTDVPPLLPDLPIPERPVPPPLGAGPSAVFQSAMPNTRKVTVRCDQGARGDGDTQAAVFGETLGTCKVTGLTTDRTRLTATVEDAEARAYRCFEGGKKECD